MKEIKKMLLKEKQNLLKDITDKTHQEATLEHDIGDDIDSSVEEQGRELELILHNRERIKLEQIEEALRRIEAGEYGDCEECGEPIGKKRLMILPFARLCLNCQREQERVEGRSLVILDDTNTRYPTASEE